MGKLRGGPDLGAIRGGWTSRALDSNLGLLGFVVTYACLMRVVRKGRRAARRNALWIVGAVAGTAVMALAGSRAERLHRLLLAAVLWAVWWKAGEPPGEAARGGREAVNAFLWVGVLALPAVAMVGRGAEAARQGSLAREPMAEWVYGWLVAAAFLVPPVATSHQNGVLLAGIAGAAAGGGGARGAHQGPPGRSADMGGAPADASGPRGQRCGRQPVAGGGRDHRVRRTVRYARVDGIGAMTFQAGCVCHDAR